MSFPIGKSDEPAAGNSGLSASQAFQAAIKTNR